MKAIESKKISIKLISIILMDLVIIGCIICFGLFRQHVHIKINGTYFLTPSTVAEFHFIDNYGRSFTKKNLQGHWTMLFFGFTHCAMVCPTTMAVLNKMYKELQKDLSENQLPLVVFISVDPERDTIDKLNQFVNSFNPHFIGARAGIAEIIALEKQLHITVSKMNSIDHSTEILLLNPDIKVQAYFSYPHQSEQMVTDYKKILNAS